MLTPTYHMFSLKEGNTRVNRYIIFSNPISVSCIVLLTHANPYLSSILSERREHLLYIQSFWRMQPAFPSPSSYFSPIPRMHCWQEVGAEFSLIISLDGSWVRHVCPARRLSKINHSVTQLIPNLHNVLDCDGFLTFWFRKQSTNNGFNT